MRELPEAAAMPLPESKDAPENYLESLMRQYGGGDSLDLSRMRFTLEELLQIAADLKINNTLKSLSLGQVYDDWVGANFAAAIADALKGNRCLEDLDMSNNGLFPLGGNCIAEALRENTTLRRLNLSSTALADAGVAAIANALGPNSALITLELRRNHIHSEGAAALAMALNRKIALEKLDLCSNGIDLEGVGSIGNALGNNPHSKLIYLNLNYNRIDSLGVKALAEALDRNPILQTLHMTHNGIGKERADAIRQLLSNPGLIEIDLSGNNALCSPENVAAIAATLRENTRLHTLRLYGDGFFKLNMFDAAGVDTIVHALGENMTLRCLELVALKNGVGHDVPPSPENQEVIERIRSALHGGQQRRAQYVLRELQEVGLPQAIVSLVAQYYEASPGWSLAVSEASAAVVSVRSAGGEEAQPRRGSQGPGLFDSSPVEAAEAPVAPPALDEKPTSDDTTVVVSHHGAPPGGPSW